MPATLRAPRPHRLMLALIGAFPALAVAQPVAAPRVSLPAPAANALPVKPATGPWLVNGSATSTASAPGAAAALTIQQASQRAIYRWQSFDIGASARVSFDMAAGANSAALNRVVGLNGSIAPSRIFGQLTSNGQVLLVNQNGILFGAGASVNVGGLIASTLDVGDDDFLNGLTTSLRGAAPTFRLHDVNAADPLALYANPGNFVLVEPGAAITTASGGRIFLLAESVENRGTLASPAGQVVLAAGDTAYLQAPTAEAIYASEANPAIPALRGLLVEVDGAGRAANLGNILTERGNTTLVGLAVNQNGRISATTGVSENGSVFLLARGRTVAEYAGNDLVKRASTGGELTLGSASRLELGAADEASNGVRLTSTDNSTFTAGRVELSGRSIDFAAGASIAAPGAQVRARAEAVPNYAPTPATNGAFSAADAASRITVAAGAVIDVAGTTSEQLSVARQFVTTELLGNNDLKDAPLQKDGPLYRSKVTFDLRAPVPILGDTSSYRANLQRSANERLATGGSVLLQSAGSVVTQQGSRIDVSGGEVSYTDALVRPTFLVSTGGARVTLNNAAKDERYARIDGAATPALSRWGTVAQYGANTQGITEAGYVDGRPAGAIQVIAPRAVLDGTLAGSASAGRRQWQGLDAAASAGSFQLGAPTHVAAFGSSDYRGAITNTPLQLGRADGSVPADYWASFDPALLPAASRIAAPTLAAGGFAGISLSTDAGIVQAAGADLLLAPRTSLTLNALGEGGITLDGRIASVGGTVAVRSADASALTPGGETVAGAITLAASAAIDVAGNWVNQWRADGTAPQAAALAGGSVSLRSAHGLLLREGADIDVSGGVTVTASGALRGTAAGRITLEADNMVRQASDALSAGDFSAALHGHSLTGGGTLRLRAGAVLIGPGSDGGNNARLADAGTLTLADTFFSQGGFNGFDIEGARRLEVLAGAQITPRAASWVAAADVRNARSGARPADVLAVATLADALRPASTLTLQSNGAERNAPNGSVVVAAGARIELDPGAALTLNAGRQVVLDGAIRAPGGAVGLNVGGTFGGFSGNYVGELRLGEAAVIDTSGVARGQPTTDGSRPGSVLAGGSIGLAVVGAQARLSTIDVQPGALLRADGAAAQLTPAATLGAAPLPPGSTVVVASAGGDISVAAREGGALLAGVLQSRGGSAGTPGGRFSLRLDARDELAPESAPNNVADASVVLQQGREVPALKPASVTLSADQLQGAGFADVSITASDRIVFDGAVSLALPRDLTLDAPVLQAGGATPGSITLAAASVLRLGNTDTGARLATAGSSNQALRPASGGAGALSASGGLIELAGVQSLQGIGRVSLAAGSELRLRGAADAASEAGRLSSAADLSFSAPFVAPATHTQYVIDAPGQSVRFAADPAAGFATPLAAGGSLTVNASRIDQGGRLLAPFGRIDLNAGDSLRLAPGSVTSVSGSGLTVPYGSTAGSDVWSFAGSAITAPVEKAISLTVPGGAIDVQAGALLDLSGGGSVLATAFVPGPGGSRDIFAGAADGAFAVLPGVRGYAPFDLAIATQTDDKGLAPATRLGDQISFGSGGPLPAGTYAVLPARYAVLPGAFLVRPTNAAVALGVAQAQPDGGTLVGATRSAADTAFDAGLPRGYLVTPSATARRASEITLTDDAAFFTAQAARDEAALPRLARDAGSLNLAALGLDLSGQLRFAVPPVAAGGTAALGGELNISAPAIRVGSGNAADAAAGTLQVSAAQLAASGADSILLGGLRSGSANGGAAARTLTVGARTVEVEAGALLQAGDLVLAATDSVTLQAGAALQASGSAAAQALTVQGDGALLRVSADASAGVTRSGAQRASGELTLGDGTRLQGAGVTAEGTKRTALAGSALISAEAVTLGASRFAVGDLPADAALADALRLTPALAQQLGSARDLTLRSYGSIDLFGSATLGSAAQQTLTLDTAEIRVQTPGAAPVIAAGRVTLANSSSPAVAPQAAAGGAVLTLQGGGDVRVTGPVAVSGAARVAVDAGGSLLLGDGAALRVPGDLALAAAGLTATQGAEASLQADGALTLTRRPTGTAATPAGAGSGAHLSLTARQITQGGLIELPSGELTLSARGPGGIVFDAGSTTTLAGRSSSFDGLTINTPGGALRVQADAGDVRIAADALIDVSAAPGAATPAA